MVDLRLPSDFDDDPVPPYQPFQPDEWHEDAGPAIDYNDVNRRYERTQWWLNMQPMRPPSGVDLSGPPIPVKLKTLRVSLLLWTTTREPPWTRDTITVQNDLSWHDFSDRLAARMEIDLDSTELGWKTEGAKAGDPCRILKDEYNMRDTFEEVITMNERARTRVRELMVYNLTVEEEVKEKKQKKKSKKKKGKKGKKRQRDDSLDKSQPDESETYLACFRQLKEALACQDSHCKNKTHGKIQYCWVNPRTTDHDAVSLAQLTFWAREMKDAPRRRNRRRLTSLIQSIRSMSADEHYPILDYPQYEDVLRGQGIAYVKNVVRFDSGFFEEQCGLPPGVIPDLLDRAAVMVRRAQNGDGRASPAYDKENTPANA
ncbi:hypothetical protein GLOTRDRAFT_127324 [Gloeophyllum trabeum ATCC 11539]|uniref:Uncharacterized protein n=1 Tax=Gloeophyllum trabeum (strain ATCC 11539 / FP-39264 / Madison 617) TaxID=670483 RepID=S7RUQ5_GLOTA|nr:uncharacterized protein GLOTRDRAFT_127324 [Gloeophyllum trabeum ATCC 11539]EPQ56939.1 hypothetical protein GLOTRDRAFT_127324 [Gloeophyllum trabeum ATCC 11539]